MTFLNDAYDVPLVRLFVLVLVGVIGVGVGAYLDRDLIAVTSVGLLCIGSAFIRCAWCRHPIWLHFISGTVPLAAFPFDGECPKCQRSLWTRPPI